MQIYFEYGKKWVRAGNVSIGYEDAKGIFNSMYPHYIKTFKATDKELSKGFEEYIRVAPGIIEALTTDEISGIYVLLELAKELFPDFEILRHRKRIIKREHTDLEWQCKLIEYGNRCAYCGLSGKLEKDHIIPVSKGGSDKIENIVPACHRCNASKGVNDKPK